MGLAASRGAEGARQGGGLAASAADAKTRLRCSWFSQLCPPCSRCGRLYDGGGTLTTVKSFACEGVFISVHLVATPRLCHAPLCPAVFGVVVASLCVLPPPTPPSPRSPLPPIRDKDNVSVLSQFIFFSIAVAALPVAVFFLVRRGLSPAAVVTDGGPPPPPSALVTALVSAAPRLLTASRVPSLVAALAAVLAVNVVTGAFVLRALIEDARLVAAVGGAPPASEVAAAVAEAAAAGVTREGGGGGGVASETGAAVARPAAPPSAVTTNAASAAADMPP